MMVSPRPASSSSSDFHRRPHSNSPSSSTPSSASTIQASRPFPTFSNPSSASLPTFKSAPAARHNSVSPTHSSPTSSSSAASSSASSSANHLRGTFGSLSGGSASWIGSDGTAATSEHGSPAAAAGGTQPMAMVIDATETRKKDIVVARPPGSERVLNQPTESERLRRSLSTPSLRRDAVGGRVGDAEGRDVGEEGKRGRPVRERVATSPGIKRKASGGSASARSEKVDGRSVDMRRVPTPAEASASFEGSPTEGGVGQVGEQGEEVEGGRVEGEGLDQAMREVTVSPEGEKKQRRRRDRSGTLHAAARFDTSPRRPLRRRRKKRTSIDPSASVGSIDAPPRSHSHPQPPAAEAQEPEPHIDLASYPQQDLLRLLASLLSQIATANDALRNHSGDGDNAQASPSWGVGSGSFSSIAALQSAQAGSSTSLASGFSAAGMTTSARRVVAGAAAPLTAQTGGAGQQRRESRSPWNSMPSTPYHDRKEFVGAGFTPMNPDATATVARSGGGSSLSRPPTPGASRAGSPTATRRGSVNALPSLAEIPSDDLFSASRTALNSPSATLAFHARNIPQITIEAYLLRILKYCPTSNEVFVSLLVYFDRMARMAGLNGSLDGGSGSGGGSPKAGRKAEAAGQDGEAVGQGAGGEEAKPFAIDSFNVHRLVIAGVTVASKFFSDVFYTNSRYAKVGGLPLYELDQLELQFLLINDFRLMIPLEEMQRYADQLLMHWDGAKGTSGYREPKPPPPPPPPPSVPEEEEDDEDYEDWGSDDDSDRTEEEEEAEGMDNSGELPMESRQETDGDVEEAARTVSSATLAPSHHPASMPSEQPAARSFDVDASGHISAGSDSMQPNESGDEEDITARPRSARSQPSTSRLSIAGSERSSEASASTATPGTPKGTAATVADEDSCDPYASEEEPWTTAAIQDDDVEMDG